MSVVTSSPVFDGQHDSTVHTHIDQVPDDYVIRRTSRHVDDVLSSKDHSQFMPENTRISAQIVSNTFPGKATQTINQLDAEKVVPPIDSLILDKAKTRPERTLTPISEWEGYVEDISENDFSVRMVNVRSKSSLPADMATFDKDEVSKYDRQLLKEGAIVRWVVGRERLSTGQIRNVSELYFRRLPAHTEKDYKRAYEMACTLLAGIDWDNETEG